MKNAAQKWSKTGPRISKNRVKNLQKPSRKYQQNRAAIDKESWMNVHVFQGFMNFRLGAAASCVHSEVHSVTSKSNCGLDFHRFWNQKIRRLTSGNSRKHVFCGSVFHYFGLTFVRNRAAKLIDCGLFSDSIWSRNGSRFESKLVRSELKWAPKLVSICLEDLQNDVRPPFGSRGGRLCNTALRWAVSCNWCMLIVMFYALFSSERQYRSHVRKELQEIVR